MVKSMNAAVAGLRTHQTRMDVISNNIANINTWGYKARMANFQDSLYTNLVTSSAGSTTAGNTGGVNASQIGYGSGVGSISSNFTVGSGQYTGNSLDCMINGPAFFIVGPFQRETNNGGGAGGGNGLTVDGDGKIQLEDPDEDADGNYTGKTFPIGETSLTLSRVGIFTVDSNGYLVDANGNYVYGYDANPDYDEDQPADPKNSPILYDKLVPIRLPEQEDAGGGAGGGAAADYEPIKMTTYTVGKDGTIVGVDRDKVPHVIGQLAVVLVQNPNGLEQDNGYLFAAGENAGDIYLTTSNAATGEIKSNYLEMSNVDLANEFSLMITGQRGYQANTKMITVTDQMLEELVNMKR